MPFSAFFSSTVPLIGDLMTQLSSRHRDCTSRASAAATSARAACTSASAAWIISFRGPSLRMTRSASSLATRASAARKSLRACTCSWGDAPARVRVRVATSADRSRWALDSASWASTWATSTARTLRGSWPASLASAAASFCLALATEATASS